MWRLLVLAFIASASAQIPSLGWCPDYQPMGSFNMNQFLGTWYEAERYFTVSELGSRCVTTKYQATPEGRILVSNEITMFLTGMKRVLDGSLQVIGREGEGRVIVKYTSLPMPYDTEYSVLDTDYDNFAVMWSCSGIGPVHTQNAWIMTRDRLPNAATMQMAYAVLDRFKISRAFFLKTNQDDCNILPAPAAEPLMKAADEVVVAKSSPVVPLHEEPVKPVEVPIEKRVDPELKSSVPLEKIALPEAAAEPIKPMQVPELIMSESSEMKEEKKDKMEEDKMKPMKPMKPIKPEIPEKMDSSSESKEKMPEPMPAL